MNRLFSTLAAAALLLVSAGAWSAAPPAEQVLKERVLGDPNAPIEIVEYASLTCPHCRQFHIEILPDLKKNYIDTGRAKLVFRDFPFDQLGLTAAILARCAPPPRYFKFLDVLFQNQEKWSQDVDPVKALARIGTLGGLSEEDFKACVEDRTIIDGVLKARLEFGNRYQVNSTPTFIINDEKRIVGSQSYKVFDDMLRQLEK